MAAISNTKRKRMPAQRFAFPKERKEPLNDANHVRAARPQPRGLGSTSRPRSQGARSTSNRQVIQLRRRFSNQREIHGWTAAGKRGAPLARRRRFPFLPHWASQAQPLMREACA